MGKAVPITAGVFLAAGVALWLLLGGSESESAIARFQARLVAARDGRAAERLVIVVRGTFDEWHALVAKASVASIPDQP